MKVLSLLLRNLGIWSDGSSISLASMKVLSLLLRNFNTNEIKGAYPDLASMKVLSLLLRNRVLESARAAIHVPQ